MIANPSVVVLDEALSSLDAVLQNDILRLLLHIERESNVAYIFISHDMKAVLDMSDRVLVMYLGRIVESFGPEALTRDGFIHPYSVLLESASRGPGAAGALPTISAASYLELQIADVRSPGCRFATRCPLADDRCRTEEPELRAYGPDHLAACYHPGELTQGEL